MTTRPLYLSHRPSTFAEVFGQDHIKEILRHQVQNDSTFHTYLFFGTRWCGKTSTARILAKAINCTNTSDGNPCNECDACKLVESSADIVEIDAASHTGVDNIRDLIIDKMNYRPTHLQKKVYIIDEVHMLSKSAFNALLKIMEEAPEYIVFILATTEIHKIPETIISRSQVFQFKRYAPEDIATFLAQIAVKEKIDYEEEALTMIANLADGAIRDWLKYLEQASIMGAVTQSNVTSLLWVVPSSTIDAFIAQLTAADSSGAIQTIEQLHEWWADLYVFIRDTLSTIDKRYSTDPSLYSPIVQKLFPLHKELKQSPFPLLLCKHALLAEETSTHTPIAPSPPAAPQQAPQKKTPPPTPEEEKKTIPVPKETTKDDPAPSPSTDTPSLDMHTIHAQLVEHIQDTKLKNILSQYCSPHWFEDNILSISVVNPLHHKLINRPEHIKTCEQTLQSIYDQRMWISFIFVSKEAFLDL